MKHVALGAALEGVDPGFTCCQPGYPCMDMALLGPNTTFICLTADVVLRRPVLSRRGGSAFRA